MDEIVIKVEGKEFTGWKALEVKQGLDYLCPSFAMQHTDLYPNESKNTSLVIGKECTVEINGYRLVTGYIDDISSGYDKSNHSIEIRGRDKLQDLVDCSYWKEGYNNEWKDQTIKKLIEKLCNPFNIEIVIDDSVDSIVGQNVSTKIKDFKTREGDTVADALMRIARVSALLPVGYGDGKLTLTRSTTDKKAVTSLETGKNILSASLSSSNIERYSHYIVKGQGKGYDNLLELDTYVQPSAVARDTLVSRSRYRPLVILAEEIVDRKKCQNRAIWESTIRAGKSRQYQYAIAGWLQEDGSPWILNSLIKINDTVHSIQDDLLCSEIIYKLSEQGQVTNLTLVDKKMYELVEQADKIKNKKHDYSIDDLVKR